MLDEQHPSGHPSRSQTQVPATQCWPAPVHAGFDPHRHTPPLQLSAVIASHHPHAPPPVPHADSVFPAWHCAPVSQHPLQLKASQMHPAEPHV